MHLWSLKMKPLVSYVLVCLVIAVSAIGLRHAAHLPPSDVGPLSGAVGLPDASAPDGVVAHRHGDASSGDSNHAACATTGHVCGGIVAADVVWNPATSEAVHIWRPFDDRVLHGLHPESSKPPPRA